MAYTIISSNIRFDNPADGRHSWDSRKHLLWDVLNSYAPDILGSQEARRPQLQDFSKGLQEIEMISRHREWIDERMYPCIFVNPRTIDVLDSGDIWLSETPQAAGSKSFESAFPRLATWIKGKFSATGLAFFYMNTHLDHVHEKTRIEQAQVLVAELIKANVDNLPVILSGDFNAAPISQVRDAVEKLRLNDPWSQPEETSFHKFHGVYPGGNRIDWILFDKIFDCLNISFDKTSRAGSWPSDHFPLVAKFTF